MARTISSTSQSLLCFNNLAHPRQTFFHFIFALNAFLVLPMGSDTVFCGNVHIPCANLDFERNTLSAKNGVCRDWYMLDFGVEI